MERAYCASSCYSSDRYCKGNLMTDKQQYLVKLDGFEFADGQSNSGWLHVFTLGTVWDKRYGFFELTPARMKRFADNVNEKALGTDVPIDFSHMNGPDGERAAGWGTKAVTADPNGSGSDGLWLWVDWTPRAAQEIRGGEWRYASAMFADVWTDARGHQHQDVLLGTAVTNHPVLKDLTPINLSEFPDLSTELYELGEPTLDHVDLATVDNSTWDGEAAMKSCTSASDYRAVCAGRRDGDPSKSATWALPHHKTPGAPPNKSGVSSALGRFDQTQGLVNKDGARRHLEAHQRAIKAMSATGGEMELKVLAGIFGLPDDATEEEVAAKAKEAVAKLTAEDAEAQRIKTFKEQYPEQAAQMEADRKELADMRVANRLTEINAHITKLTESGPFALPTKIIDDFRELRASLTVDADAKLAAIFDELVKDGLVKLGEVGSGRKGAEDQNSKTLAEVMTELKSEHEDWDTRKVLAEALKLHPELEQEHLDSAPTGSGGEN